ncbi:MAG: tetratricopeptide repeat protein [Saprospiraceae bacterium]
MNPGSKLLLIFVASVLAPLPSSEQQSRIVANNRLDSLIRISSQLKSDSSKVMLLNQISFEYNTISPYDGIRYALQAEMMAESLNYKAGKARAYSCLGANYFSLADYPKAYTYWLKALTLNEENGNKNGLANHMHNIGLVFFKQKEYDKAVDYFEKALKVSQEIGNRQFATNSYTAIGNIYFEKNEIVKALEYHFKSLAMDEETGNKRAISTDMMNIATVFNAQGDHQRAEQMINRALNMKKEAGDPMGTARSYFLAAQIMLDTHDKGVRQYSLKHAERLLDSAITISKDMGFLEILQNSYELLAGTEEKLGNYQQSLFYTKGYHSMRDSVFSASRRDQIFNLEKKFELENERHEFEKDQEAKERIRNIQIAGISFFIIFLLGIVLVMSQKKIQSSFVSILSSMSLVVLFHFIQLLFHESLSNFTHHNLLLTFILTLGLGALIIEVHHMAEQFMKKKLSQ